MKKYNTIISVFALMGIHFITGCGASARVGNTNAYCLPRPTVTRTVTETTKIDTPVPVYKINTEISSHTSTSAGAPPLHRVEVIPESK